MVTAPRLRFKDTWQEFNSIAEMAMVRVDQPGPNLGGSQCPAWQFTFAVSEDDGASWRNPTTEEKEELAQAIRDTGRCCQRDITTCSVRR